MTHRKLLAIIRDPTFWRAITPQLTVGASPDRPRMRGLEAGEVESVQRQLREEGYFRIAAISDPADMARLEAGLAVLTRAGWPALFVFLFDEPWLVYAGLDNLLRHLLGPNYRPLAAFWAWCLEKSDCASGWGPHRDHVTRTVSENGDPEAVTLWVPITEATPDNGCIYVLPAPHDPNYCHDLKQCNVASLQDVRALPAKVGTVLGWNHQLLHWGGRASARATSPRMSLSAEFQRSDGPLLDAVLEERVPPFSERLALVGKQLIAYQHMQQPSTELLDIAQQLVRGSYYA